MKAKGVHEPVADNSTPEGRAFEPPSRNPYPSTQKNGTGSTARNFAIRNNRKQNQERDVRKPGIPF